MIREFTVKKLSIYIIVLILTSSLVSADEKQSYPGAVNRTDIRLISESQFNPKDALKKTFQDGNFSGWLSTDANWYIKGRVPHTRLRCATYELGVQLGKGAPACLNVKWISGVHYGTRKSQCNSTTMEHSGGGEVPEFKTKLNDATCVRIITKCTGVCEGAEQ